VDFNTPKPWERAVMVWVVGRGERLMDELERVDRLAFACEKAPTTDPVIEKVCC